MDFVIAGISLNDLAEQERLPSLRYTVSNHFLFDTSVFSLALIVHCQLSRQKKMAHFERKNLTAKRKRLLARQKRITTRQKK